MKKSNLMYLVLLLLVGATHLEGQEKAAAFPETAQMEKYPIISDTTGHVAKMVEMGLHLGTLQSDLTAYNWYAKWHGFELNRFVYETLSTGTEVWVDSDDVAWYKADCVNRLATEEDCSDCPIAGPEQLRALADDTLLTLHLDQASLRALLGEMPTGRDADTVVVENHITLPIEHDRSWWGRNQKWVIGGVAILGVAEIANCIFSDSGCYLVSVRQKVNIGR